MSNRNVTECTHFVTSSCDSLLLRQQQAKGWTLDKIKANPEKRFFKSHANLKQLPVGTAKGLKVNLVQSCYHYLYGSVR